MIHHVEYKGHKGYLNIASNKVIFCGGVVFRSILDAIPVLNKIDPEGLKIFRYKGRKGVITKNGHAILFEHDKSPMKFPSLQIAMRYCTASDDD